MDETIFISTCCRKEANEDYKPNPRDRNDDIDIYVCSKCKQECDVEEVCAYCLDTLEVSTDESDGEGHIQSGVGTQKCNSPRHNPADFSGADGSNER